MNFRIRGLEARQFDHLFALSDAELAERGAVRRIADGPRPCRISLSAPRLDIDATHLRYLARTRTGVGTEPRHPASCPLLHRLRRTVGQRCPKDQRGFLGPEGFSFPQAYL